MKGRIDKLDIIKMKFSALGKTLSRGKRDKPETGRKCLQKNHLKMIVLKVVFESIVIQNIQWTLRSH